MSAILNLKIDETADHPKRKAFMYPDSLRSPKYTKKAVAQD